MKLNSSLFYNDWLNFSSKQSIVECDFFAPAENPVTELLGDFSKARLIAFGEHASGSLLALYSKNEEQSVENVPVAWLDSEGSPCIVISNNLKEFLSILPYGMGFVYTIAAIIEDNLSNEQLLSGARSKFVKTAEELLEESEKRFLNVDNLISWLGSHNIQLNNDPVKLIIEAHEKNNDLTKWIAESLN